MTKETDPYGADSNEFDELHGMKSTSWVPDYESRDLITFPRSKTKWRAWRHFSERVLHHDVDVYDNEIQISEASAICVVEQVEGPNVGMRAILKTRMEIPTHFDEESEMEYGVDYSSQSGAITPYAATEFYNLKRLTELGSTCTPKLIDFNIRRQGKTENVPGGFKMQLLMERLPGRNLLNFRDLPMSERDQVRIAFGKAIREFYSYGCLHKDPHIRNLMWDRESQKCYIIDLEEVYDVIDSDIEHPRFYKAIEFYNWNLASRFESTSTGIDPMVPDFMAECEPEWDDATLQKLATDATGKEIWFPGYM